MKRFWLGTSWLQEAKSQSLYYDSKNNCLKRIMRSMRKRIFKNKKLLEKESANYVLEFNPQMTAIIIYDVKN